MNVFLDACALIYLIEGEPALSDRVRAAISHALAAAPEARIAISALSLLECRVRPLREQNAGVLAQYQRFLASPDLQIVELSRPVVELATLLRAEYGLRTPDALQAASCLSLGAEHRFLTGDHGFARVPGLQLARLT